MRALAAFAILTFVFTADAAPKKKKHVPSAVVLVVDTSGSMQGNKLESVKEGIKVVAETVDPADQVAVIQFDSAAKVVVPLAAIGNKKAFADKITAITSGGGTAFTPALQAAYDQLHGSKLARKHVIFLSDGEAASEGVAAIVKKLSDEHVTITAIGVAGADRNLLQAISEGGNGRLYMVEDLGAVPKIFMKEIKEATP